VHEWEDPGAKELMIRLSGDWLILVNGSASQVPFHLPPGKWSLQLASADDAAAGPPIEECVASARSVTVMIREGIAERKN
jgi:glycogen operon protein